MGKRQEKMDAMSRFEKCRHRSYDGFRAGATPICHYGAKTLGDIDRVKRQIDPQECENCPNYKSRWLEFPQTFTDIKTEQPSYWNTMFMPVRIRLCEDSKTYFGVYLGEFPRYITARMNEDKELEIGTAGNPCIFVPEKKSVYFGDESWWQPIKPGEDIRDITNETIRSQWYVELLEKMAAEEAEE